MVYVEQAGKRRIDQRPVACCNRSRRARTGIWTLTTAIDARDREAAICEAVDRGNQIVIVPYRLVSGVNLRH